MRSESKQKAWLAGLFVVGIAAIVIALFLDSKLVDVIGFVVLLAVGAGAWMSWRSAVRMELNENSTEDQFRTFIQESQVVADRLAAAVEEVNRSIGHLSQIADASIQSEEELQARSKHAAGQLQEAFAAIQQVAAAADQILDSSLHMHRESEQTKDTVVDVCRSLNATDEVMNNLHTNNDSMQEKIKDLTAHTSKIEEINTFITEVVAQTSLLALNASIEAARAGEQGRGFSVVAQEIKKLAAQSHEAVQSSSELLSAIEQGVAQVVAAVELEKASVISGIEEMKIMKSKIDTIFSLILNVNSLVASTTNSTEHQSSLVIGTRTSLGGVVDLMNETMSSVEHALTQMKQQRQEVSGLQVVNHNLAKSSTELIQAIGAVGLRQKQGTVNANLQEMKQLLNGLVLQADILSLLEDKHAAQLSGVLRKTTGIEAIWSNRADGTFIFSQPEAGLVNAKGRDWWKRAMEGELFVSPEYVSAITKKPCITISRAIKDDMGKAVGVVGIDLVVN
ncbi:methyl-accepting chemotaxis protein [Paenibacillus ferrarius]|uniref:methyl-accepting chemotaxis protein n=1 Tax=Paenibacillus ferrarius TaxID=1469647 RepID=UPI003D283EF1